MNRRPVIVVANDIVPGQAMPVAAPGLRAHGLASGLRQHGFDVSLIVMSGPVEKQWMAQVPVPRPSNSIVLQRSDLMTYLRSRSPVSVIYTNSNLVDHLEPQPGVHYTMDFFAPKVLELVSSRADYSQDQLARLTRRKIRAIELADAIVVNGQKKIPYVLDWIGQAGRDPASLPIGLAEMCVPGRFEEPTSGGQLTISITGYAQEWSQPGSWVKVLHQPLEEGDLSIVIARPPHWGNIGGLLSDDAMAELSRLPGVASFGALPFAQFRSTIAHTHLSMDLFDYSMEREYAMVTRTVVALSTGLPVIHPPFTEVSPLIEEYDAGWIIDPADEENLGELLHQLIRLPEVSIAKRKNARLLWKEHFEPKVATGELANILDQNESA